MALILACMVLYCKPSLVHRFDNKGWLYWVQLRTPLEVTYSAMPSPTQQECLQVESSRLMLGGELTLSIPS